MDTPYRPAPAVLEQLRAADFVAVVGPTAAGKTTLIKAAAAREPRLHMLVAGTSRPMRPGEHEGVDFYFDSRERMEQKARAGEYATCVRHPSGDLYTTSVEEYPAGKVTLLATMASALEVFRQLPYRSFRTIYFLPPSYAVWQERLGQHPLEPAQLRRRLEEAAQSLAFGLQDSSTHFMVNDELELATAAFTALALGDVPQIDPAAPGFQSQSHARALAADLLAALRRQLHQG